VVSLMDALKKSVAEAATRVIPPKKGMAAAGGKPRSAKAKAGGD
jgi:hypothetical protein